MVGDCPVGVGFPLTALVRSDHFLSPCLLFLFYRIILEPGFIAAFEGGGMVALLLKLLRRTGAGGFIRSGAVGDDIAVFRAAVSPDDDLIRKYPNAAGDLAFLTVVVGTRAHIQHDGWVGAFEPGG